MNAIITQTNNAFSERKYSSGRNVVYVKSPLDKVADDFFHEHKIYNLDFKCHTWNKVCRIVTQQHTTALKQLFPDATSIKFSAKAGCSCGCSPGYLVKTEPSKHGCDHWVTVEATAQEIDHVSSRIHGLIEMLECEIQDKTPVTV